MKLIKTPTKGGLYLLQDIEYGIYPKETWIVYITRIYPDNTIAVKDLYILKDSWEKLKTNKSFKTPVDDWLQYRSLYKINKKEIEKLIFLDMI